LRLKARLTPPTPQRKHPVEHQMRPLQSSADSMTLTALITRRTLRPGKARSTSLLLV